MAGQFTLRRDSMKFTDQRANIILEVLSGFRDFLFPPSLISFVQAPCAWSSIFAMRRHS
jgi:hypothetical protein